MTEHGHQVVLIQWFDRTYPEYQGRLFAIPNGGFRHAKTAQTLKMEGVRRGVPDLMLPIPTDGCCGLFIELKSDKGRATLEQKNWIDFLNRHNYKAEVCKGFEQAQEVIKCYLNSIIQQTLNG